MKEIGVGILGFGTIGAGVVEGLLNNGDLIEKRTGVRLALKQIADLDLDSDRGVNVDRSLLTTNAKAVVDNPDVRIIVELIGGTTIAKELVIRALKQGKPVVTANKALLADHGPELYRLAEEHEADIYFEASVGGGIPIIKSLREGLCANNIVAMAGILNGTCNYILTRMEREGMAFDAVLKEAQEAGYAEAEPSLDIDGIDTAHKAAILGSLAYGFPIPTSEVKTEGIRTLASDDIGYAKELGYRIKLLAVIKQVQDKVEICVQPTLVPLGHMLASVSGVFNAVMVHGDVVGNTLYYGQGAGRAATSSAVLGDIVDVGLNITLGYHRRLPLVPRNPLGQLCSSDDVIVRYYLRLMLPEKPGMLAQIAGVLGEYNISIASVIQKETIDGDYVPVIIVTHSAKEKEFSDALSKIDAMEMVGAETVKLRIEDFA